MCDIVFVAPRNDVMIYQSLASDKLSAVEPPTWALLLAGSMRSKGYDPVIVDSLAETMTDEELVQKVSSFRPRVICFVVYGQNVNAGTTNMSGAVRQAEAIKESACNALIVCVGSHVQALPIETLEREKSLDVVVLNEGVKALESLLLLKNFSSESLASVPGIAFRSNSECVFGLEPISIGQDVLEIELPEYAWDLLPFSKKPLDYYRSPQWHADYQEEFRSPYAAIQTSLGCQFKCEFCMINLINKNDTQPVSVASDYSGMRFWSTDFVIREVTKLVGLGVTTIRFTDEMFFLNKKRYLPILQVLKKINFEDKLRLWAYARIDTVPPREILTLIREAGFRWLCLGIESGNKYIRLEVAKGKFEDVDVQEVVHHIESAGINVMANYIFGLPGDTEESIVETFNLSVRLNTLGWNTYAAMALPGSPLYKKARDKGVDLPVDYEEFGFHSESCKPLPTDSLPARRILELRDEKFVEYFGRPEFLEKIEIKFGKQAAHNVFVSSRKRLKRKIFGSKGEL